MTTLVNYSCKSFVKVTPGFVALDHQTKKITAVINGFVIFRMITSLGGNIKLLAMSPTPSRTKLEVDVKKSTSLFKY